jgi:hypothetical protein
MQRKAVHDLAGKPSVDWFWGVVSSEHFQVYYFILFFQITGAPKKKNLKKNLIEFFLADQASRSSGPA